MYVPTHVKITRQWKSTLIKSLITSVKSATYGRPQIKKVDFISKLVFFSPFFLKYLQPIILMEKQQDVTTQQQTFGGIPIQAFDMPQSSCIEI